MKRDKDNTLLIARSVFYDTLRYGMNKTMPETCDCCNKEYGYWDKINIRENDDDLKKYYVCETCEDFINYVKHMKEDDTSLFFSPKNVVLQTLAKEWIFVEYDYSHYRKVCCACFRTIAPRRGLHYYTRTILGTTSLAPYRNSDRFDICSTCHRKIISIKDIYDQIRSFREAMQSTRIKLEYLRKED